MRVVHIEYRIQNVTFFNEFREEERVSFIVQNRSLFMIGEGLAQKIGRKGVWKTESDIMKNPVEFDSAEEAKEYIQRAEKGNPCDTRRVNFVVEE